MTIKARSKRRPVRPAQIARAIDEGRESLDLYLDEISRVPLLNREEEMELARKAFKGNVVAQERLARHNVRFVILVPKSLDPVARGRKGPRRRSGGSCRRRHWRWHRPRQRGNSSARRRRSSGSA